MEILRTPEERFSDLPDFAYQPHYFDLPDGLRMAFIDEGPPQGPVALLLHGEPTWSYLYRKMIPVLVARGIRVVAPDLIGFGRSDKPSGIGDYSYQRHMDWLDAFISGLNLRDITLFCQDWGSLLGLRHAAEHSDRYARIMVSNGFLPTGELGANSAFRLWRGFARYSPVFPVGAIVNSGCVQKLSDAEIAAYDAPFPSQAYKAAARAFPLLVPTDTRNPASAANQAAWAALSRFEKPFLCVFGKNDPILGKADKPLIAAVPGARGQAHERTWGGHFIQEDRGAYLAGRMADFMMGVVSQQAAKETVR